MKENEKNSEETSTKNVPEKQVHTEDFSSIKMSAREIESLYQQGTIVYTEGIRRYSLEIEKIKNKIDIEYQNKKAYEETLLVLDKAVEYEEKLLNTINIQFSQKINSIEELKNEYQEILKVREYTKLLKRKERELSLILDEIEEREMTVLHKELERLNILEKVEPIRREIQRLHQIMQELELEKEYFASTKLHQIPQLSLSYKKEEFVDTVVMEV